MRERPILFGGPMVRAILAGAKTQTRRAVKPGTPDDWNACPYGAPGGRLWVREGWMDLQGTGIEHRNRDGKLQRYAYRADSPPGSYGDEARKDYGLKWRPSIHMPRAASRITLEITDVRVERLQEISADDAKAEGISEFIGGWWCEHDDAEQIAGMTPQEGYAHLWERINGAGSWATNPLVWVVRFKRADQAPNGQLTGQGGA